MCSLPLFEQEQEQKQDFSQDLRAYSDMSAPAALEGRDWKLTHTQWEKTKHEMKCFLQHLKHVPKQLNIGE